MTASLVRYVERVRGLVLKAPNALADAHQLKNDGQEWPSFLFSTRIYVATCGSSCSPTSTPTAQR